MFGIPAERALPWAEAAYIGAIGLAAMFAVIGLLAGLVQSRLNARLNDAREEAFAKYRTDAAVELLRAESEGKQAEQRASEARERAAKLEINAGDAGRQLEEARLAVEHERTARLELIAGLAVRHIPQEKVLDIRLAIMGKIPKIFFSYLRGDRETLPFAQEVRSAIVNTGAIVVDRPVVPNAVVPPGLVITIPDEKFAFLPAAFEHAGVAVHKVVAPGHDIEISVGTKPSPF